MTVAFRVVAIFIAVAAIIDPAFAVQRPQPLRVDVRIGSSRALDARAVELREEILRFASIERGAARTSGPLSAVVLIAPATEDLATLPAGVPVSLVDLDPKEGVRILRVSPPAAVLPGQVAVVTADIEAYGRAGTASVIALEQHGVELARATAHWSRDSETQTVSLTYAPPAPGAQRLRVVLGTAGETGRDDGGVVDVPVTAQSRELRVMTYEPRPSWGAAFVRRALEADPVFASAAFARASRGIEVRAGGTPDRLTAASLEPFDAVIVGAPESLSAEEVQALDSFARTRGGAVILLPDRRPSGAYLRLLPAQRFDEVLVETPLSFEPSSSPGLKATEFALPQDVGPAAAVMASVRLREQVRPVIVSWPLGAGRLVFSGALDAWRYRADDAAAFAKYWTGLVANLAASAPRRLDVSVHPPLASPGDRVVVRAAVRQTEWAVQGDRIELPALGAVLVEPDGRSRPIRLWPTAETGRFEGSIVVQQAGRFVVRASAGTLTADTPLVVADELRKGVAVATDGARIMARATGGVTVPASDLGPLAQHLRALRPAEAPATLWPMRSSWWIVAFAGALCAEWTLRRRRGLR